MKAHRAGQRLQDRMTEYGAIYFLRFTDIIDQHATETKKEMSSDFYLYGMVMIYDTRYAVQQYVLGFQPQFPWDSI